MDTHNSIAHALDDRTDFPLASQPAGFDEPIFDKYYDMDGQDTMAPSPKRTRSHDAVPKLPPKSALRASRLLDNLALKLGDAVEAAELGQATTPHDVYLSSEEDASSDADDFSDYDYDSSVEDPASPSRRSSHEDTARVVSVVFAGKPSLVDLPASRKRPISSSSLGTSRTRSSSGLSAKPSVLDTDAAKDRPVTPASITSSQYSQPRPSNDAKLNRKSLLLSDILITKKPPFLSIDPYANGSSYALELPKALDSLESENQAAKTPRTPSTLLKGVTRSFSLVRKRSRPNLTSPPAAVQGTQDNTSFTSKSKKRASLHLPATVPLVDNDHQHLQPHEYEHEQPKTPMTPITYNDILKAVKKNAVVMGAASPPSDILSPTSPSPATAKRGILSGLAAARRRSMKLAAKV